MNQPLEAQGVEPHPSRQAWQVLEPYHAMIYFAPEAREAYTTAGLKGFWMGYFASRSAALGAVSAPVVVATFYNFHPRMVAKAIPDAWRFSKPNAVLAARLAAADTALRRLLGEEYINSTQLAEAAELARKAVAACEERGRPLFAAHLGLDWPTAPHLVLWHAATLLREFRGDGHVATLLGMNIDGCEAHLIQVGNGVLTRQTLQPHRGWTDQEWEAAHSRLVHQGWLTEEGRLTSEGQTVRQQLEDRTDELAKAPWQSLGPQLYRRLLELVYPLSGRIVEQAGIPMPNPMGVPWS